MAKKRIGVHVGTRGGCFTAVQRAADAGANTFQIFSASPRQWKASAVKPEDAAKMREARVRLDVNPVAIHASYLINLRLVDVKEVAVRGGESGTMDFALTVQTYSLK